jgi:hypothetical protein
MSVSVNGLIVIAINEGLAAIPDKADDAFGADTASLFPTSQRGPELIKLYLQSSTPVTWTNVRIHIFDGAMWRTLAVGGTGNIFLPSITWAKAGIPDSYVISPAGLTERMAISVGGLSGSTASAWVQYVEVG